MQKRVVSGWTYNLQEALEAKNSLALTAMRAVYDPETRDLLKVWKDKVIAEREVRANSVFDFLEDPVLYGVLRLFRSAGVSEHIDAAEAEAILMKIFLFPEMVGEIHLKYKRRLRNLVRQGGVVQRHYRRLFRTKLRLPLNIARQRRATWQRLNPVAPNPYDKVMAMLEQQKTRKKWWLARFPSRSLFFALLLALIMIVVFRENIVDALPGEFFGLMPKDVGVKNQEHAEISSPVADPDAPFIIYEPKWVPEGFELGLTMELKDEYTRRYYKGDSYILLKQFDSRQNRVVDTENLPRQDLILGDHEVVLYRGKIDLNFTWVAGFTRLSVVTNMSFEDATEFILNLERGMDR